jgi:valyl-tRNA synthetase
VETRFDPSAYERKWQREWRDRGWFAADAASERPAYCIMIPPPNVTGRLHMGHALQSTLQDVLTRWRRMRGDEALWLPGTDHAGIATQLMVERELAREGTDRLELGRERFLERMWQWKERYQDNIRRQLEVLGASCDFGRERFTLDEGLSRAVREAFVRLHAEGRIYRGEYLVNWSTGLDTAISDLEVEMRSVHDKLWHVAYAIEGSDERIVVATTRPETMLGDTAIAFHPEDERYRRLLGRRAIVPVAGRSIPFVADPVVEREFGSGLVKVTPFHDPADFEIGRRHGLPGIQVIDRRGRMTAAAGQDFAGLEVEAAREKVLVRLRAEGHLVREEEYVHNVGFCQRSGVRVEPLVSLQWFCDVSEMAGRALDAFRAGELALVPESWGKTWEHWLGNIRPWCISRQLWWGHQIPAWYDAEGNVFVARDREEAVRQAGTDALTQDPDVLDTWFSSALWPFSTLGWPQDTADLRKFYPTTVLVTGFDILFFWVARMAMMGLHFTGRVPFGRVHLTGLVRDAEGQKMSKTKGNVLDPEELIAEYGADAVRFTLAQLDAPGRDIPLDAGRMAGYRAFGNKIWNATRFVLTKAPGGRVRTDLDPGQLELPERWILSRISEIAGREEDADLPSTEETKSGTATNTRGVNASLAAFRFDLACLELYQFFWSDFCDWYIEMAKPGLEPPTARPHVADVLVTVLERALRLLHPVMPHLTEELWQRLPGREAIHPETICLAPYPLSDPGWELDAEDRERIAELREYVTVVRNERAEAIHADGSQQGMKQAILQIEADGSQRSQRFHAWLEGPGIAPLLRGLCGVAKSEYLAELPPGGHKHRRREITFQVVFPSKRQAAVDVEKLTKDLVDVDANLVRVRARLANPGFTDKAPAAVVEGARRQLAELEGRRQTLLATIESAESARESE